MEFNFNELEQVVDKLYLGGLKGHDAEHVKLVMREAGKIAFALTKSKDLVKLATIAAAFHDFEHVPHARTFSEGDSIEHATRARAIVGQQADENFSSWKNQIDQQVDSIEREKDNPELGARFAAAYLKGRLSEDEIGLVRSAILKHSFGVRVAGSEVVTSPEPERRHSVEIALFLADKLEQIGDKAIDRRNLFLAEKTNICSLQQCVKYWKERVRRLEDNFTRYYNVLEPLYPAIAGDVEAVRDYALALERMEPAAIERLMAAFEANWKIITVSAPTKVILCGEHLVVHGKPAVALPTSIRDFITLTKPAGEETRTVVTMDTESERVEFEVTQTNVSQNGSPGDIGFISDLVRKLRDSLKITSGMHIAIRVRGFKGLGNSASISAGLAYAFHLSKGHWREYLDGPDFRKKLLQLVHEADEIAHGKASGIDATTIVMAKPLRFQRGAEPQEIKIDWAEKGSSLAIVDTYRDCRNTTKELVEKFTKNLEAMTESDRKSYLESYDWALGMFMAGKWKEAFELNQSLLGIVTSKDAGRVIEAAKPFGAAKITGAGGEGGAVIALVSDFGKFSEAVEKLGFKVHKFELDTSGVLVENIS